MIDTYTSSAACGSIPAEASEAPRGTDTDAGLMARVAEEGDREAFALLVERHKGPLVAYLGRLTGCPERAQDLAQESFLRLFRAAAGYRDRGYFRAYLFRIATNLVRSQERRAKRWRLWSGGLTATSIDSTSSEDTSPQGSVSGGKVGWWSGGHSESADHQTLERERHRLLSEAIAALPLTYRTVLVLSEIEELPHQEIAAMLDCRVGTIKSRLHRARQRLRARLEPYWKGRASAQSVGETS